MMRTPPVGPLKLFWTSSESGCARALRRRLRIGLRVRPARRMPMRSRPPSQGSIQLLRIPLASFPTRNDATSGVLNANLSASSVGYLAAMWRSALPSRRDHDLLGRGGAAAARLEYGEVSAARDRAHGAAPLTGCAGEGAPFAAELDTAVDRLVVGATDLDVDDGVGLDLRRHREAEGTNEDGGHALHEASPLFGGLGKIAEANFFVFVVIGLRAAPSLRRRIRRQLQRRPEIRGAVGVRKRRPRGWYREPVYRRRKGPSCGRR